MRELYVIYDSIRDKYVLLTIKLRRSTTPFLALKFEDIHSALTFDEEWLAQDMVDEIHNWYSKNYSEKKMNLSVRRLYA